MVILNKLKEKLRRYLRRRKYKCPRCKSKKLIITNYFSRSEVEYECGVCHVVSLWNIEDSEKPKMVYAHTKFDFGGGAKGWKNRTKF